MLETAEDKWGIKPLQNCILNIAHYIDSFCLENGIVYYLMGGSALGAVRHGGFIPWDDDLDIFMTPEDYEKFRELFRLKGDKKNYYLQEMGASNGRIRAAKLRMNKTTFVEDVFKGKNVHQGVFVDIFILHRCPMEKNQRYWQYFWSRYLVIKGLANKKNVRGGLMRRFFLLFFRLFPKRFLLDFSLKQIYRYREFETNDLCHFLGRASIRRGVYKKSFFGEPKRVNFEKIKLNVPGEVEAYLKDRFGDYMKLPSEEEIKHFQHASIWDLNKGSEALDGIMFTDEKYLL